MQKTAINMNFTQIEANIVIAFWLATNATTNKISSVKSRQFDSWRSFLHELKFYALTLIDDNEYKRIYTVMVKNKINLNTIQL